MKKLIENHWYKFNDRGDIHIGLYMGKERGYGCMICELMNRPMNFGENAHGFNLYDSTDHPDLYETFFYGTHHLPQIIADLGEYDETIIVDNPQIIF